MAKSHTMIFDDNDIFMEIYFDTILYNKLSIACTKMAKIAVANTQLPFCFETVFFCVS